MNPVVFLDGNEDVQILAFGSKSELYVKNGDVLEQLDAFLFENQGQYVFGYLSYDLKNNIEELTSNNSSFFDLPSLHFFVPEFVVEIARDTKKYVQGERTKESDAYITSFFERGKVNNPSVQLLSIQSKEEYLTAVKEIQDHLVRGDSYEVTYCQPFYANVDFLDTKKLFFDLNNVTKAPFACYLETDDVHLMCASPERFLKRESRKLTTQPIKGTSKRAKDEKEDQDLIEQLKNSEKEQAENVMIVDLVRNDLSKIAENHSVKVEELFGIYSFPTVHQMISTVSCLHQEEVSIGDILKAMFPMGSMTGAPKVKSMEIIEKYEVFKRELFSGSVGYIAPNGDFDFNVVIRSILYNPKTKTVVCPVGGAITLDAKPESEYDECLLKAEAMMKVLQGR